jgi:hypothetical protein
MNPFRSLADFALELRKQILHRYATGDPYTQEEAAAVAARLRALAADCRVAARGMGCGGGEEAVDALLQATEDLFNAPAQLSEPYSRANNLDATVHPVAKLADDYEAWLRAARQGTQGHESSEQAAGTPKLSRPAPGNAVEALLSDEAHQILEVARSRRSADDKMREICAIDRRFLGYDSPQWAELLGVSDAAIRKTAFWVRDRQQAIDADRELRGE